MIPLSLVPDSPSQVDRDLASLLSRFDPRKVWWGVMTTIFIAGPIIGAFLGLALANSLEGLVVGALSGFFLPLFVVWEAGPFTGTDVVVYMNDGKVTAVVDFRDRDSYRGQLSLQVRTPGFLASRHVSLFGPGKGLPWTRIRMQDDGSIALYSRAAQGENGEVVENLDLLIHRLAASTQRTSA